jgi:iron complex transport system ATP-binding protein
VSKDVLTAEMILNVYGVEAEVEFVNEREYSRIHPIKKAVAIAQ